MQFTSPALADGDWPLLRLALPGGADDEAVGRLTQAAVDAGALGGAVEGSSLTLYLPRAADESMTLALRRALEEERRSLGWPPAPLAADTIPDAPWATAWKDRFKSLPLGRRLLIRPDWEQGTPPPEDWGDRVTLWLRPGQGFGTGHHETTRLALTLLEDTLEPGEAMLDYGTGSGILAIAAARLGAGRIRAVDHDPQALENARDNLALNGLTEAIPLRQGGRPAAEDGLFSLVICNMLPQFALPLLEELAGRLNGVNPRLIYTGFLADQKGEVAARLSEAHLRPRAAFVDGEWGGWIAGA